MVLIVGLFIICTVVAVTVMRRRKRERAEELAADNEDFQSLMEQDLHVFTSQLDPATDADGASPEASQTDNMVRAFEAEAAQADTGVPLILHDDETEELFLLWDDTDGEEPEILVRQDVDRPEISCVYMDGKLVARVACQRELVSGDVGLMPQSAAESLGLTQLAA